MNALFAEPCCLVAVETLVPIEAGRPGYNVRAFEEEFGAILVRKLFAAWSLLLTQIQNRPIQNQISGGCLFDSGWMGIESESSVKSTLRVRFLLLLPQTLLPTPLS